MEPNSVAQVREGCGHLTARARAGLAGCLLLLTALTTGCGLASEARRAHLRVAFHEQSERLAARMRPSEPTVTVLAQAGLSSHGVKHDLDASLATLAAQNAQQPEANRTLALAELHYRAGRSRMRVQSEAAGRHYRDAAAYAILALNDPELQPLDHDQFHRAVELHNKAIDALVRSTWFERMLPGAGWGELLGRSDIALESWTPYLNGSQIVDVSIARDYYVGDMQHRYTTDGLGVPLVTHIERPEVEHRPIEQRYYNNKQWTPTTALVQVGGPARGEAWRQQPVRLALVSPFDQSSIALGGRTVPLASDRTTPLALTSRYANLSGIVRAGLLQSSFGDKGREGLYMLHNYQPGKIPVLLVHGLNSSPATWTQTVNHLRNDPVLTERFQFWVYMYPTGQPVSSSAAKFRREIRAVRSIFDPNHADPAWDRMVLIGHSMGGLVSKTATLSSGNSVYDGVFQIPLDQMAGPPELKQMIAESLYFTPVEEVKRVVFIATPHRGSRTADRLPGRLAISLINRSNGLTKSMDELKRLNGPELLTPAFRNPLLNGVGNLRYDNPALTLLNRLPTNPNVVYHSIIPQIGPVDHHLSTDGIVPYDSSHVPYARSEVITSGSHSTHQKPEVTLELKRILREHIGAPAGATSLPGALVQNPAVFEAGAKGGDGAALVPGPPMAPALAAIPEGPGALNLPGLPESPPATALAEPAALER